jgi:hypothetical protein
MTSKANSAAIVIQRMEEMQHHVDNFAYTQAPIQPFIMGSKGVVLISGVNGYIAAQVRALPYC